MRGGVSLGRRLRLALLAGGLVAVGTILVAVFPVTPGDPAPTRLRIGVVPDETPDILRQRFDPLVEYLSRSLGVPCELVIPADYAALGTRFADGDIDIAHFGGLTFVQAEARNGAVPLVLRDTDLDFQSYFLVRTDNPARSLAELKGARFAFGSRLSTSGHLMPRFFMERDGLRPEDWFSDVSYGGTHDGTAYRIRDGEADVGVANAAIIDSMFADGRLDRGSVRILMRTPPFADYVWAVQPDMPDPLRNRIHDAFLALSPILPEQAAILHRLGAGGFLPALFTDFIRLRQIAVDLSLLG